MSAADELFESILKGAPLDEVFQALAQLDDSEIAIFKTRYAHLGEKLLDELGMPQYERDQIVFEAAQALGMIKTG